ncbi:MAG: RagB/SusD family nutrient uptake outer membrane protein [Sphingobacteriaceae bacterium]|nr:MAG: RagB/SusD family nutrient uptake outer membrane protein [Sphingobacteriaceae bacterium]
MLVFKLKIMKLKNYLYILFAGATILASCKKEFLVETPPTAVPVDLAIATENDMADAVNGMYATMRSSNSYGRDIPVLGDILADNVYISSANSGRYLAENAYNYIYNNAEAADIWNQNYYTIGQANRIINSAVPSSTTSNQLKGEAYTVRGLAYLSLVNFFATPFTVSSTAAGVPIVTAFQGALTKPARNTVAQVYTRINTDLDSAFTLMGGTAIALHSTNSYYIAKYVAKAIQARAKLYSGDYAGARDAALSVVQNGGYALVPSTGYAAYWANNTGSNKSETLFELALNTATNNGTNGLDWIYSNVTNAGYGDLLATTNLYNAYSATDIRRTLITDGTRAANKAQAYLVTKYSNVRQTDRDDIKIIRYAEVLLTLAEGYARNDDEVNARLYLNQLVKQRDPSFAGYTSTGAQLISDILNERRKELAFEGLRFFDFTRLNLPINRPQTTGSAPYYPTVSITDFRRILPIPQAEIDANPNVKQNSGY